MHILKSLAIFAAFIGQMVLCCSTCPAQFQSTTSSGITLHRQKCSAYQNSIRDQQSLHQRIAQAKKVKEMRSQLEKNSTAPAYVPMDIDIDNPVPEHPGPPQASASSATAQVPDPSLPPSPPIPTLIANGRPSRKQKLPARYEDVYPEAPVAVPPPAPISTIQRVSLIVRNHFQTVANIFGLWKEYLYRPSYDPDAFVAAEDLYRPHSSTIFSESNRSHDDDNKPSAYRNKTVELVMDWQNTGSSTKSNDEVNRLVHNVLLHPKFELDDLQNFDAGRENQKMDAADEKSPFLNSFQQASIDIEVPSGSKHIPPKKFSIPGLYYRKITTLIRDTFNSPSSLKFHYTPFKLFRQHPNGKDNERIFSEMYDSDAFLEEHDKVQRAPTDDPTCKREKAVAALMFWSDATQLASFGTAKMWPIYMLFGNLSKYIRCQPDSGATKHFAYIPPFPDSLQDQLKAFHQKWDTQQKEILTHCRRELMHGVWKFLLDDDFLHAYKYGMVVHCQDGIERRIYPRIFTYSADYPEKILLATIRDQGLCPCPRCLIPKSKLDHVGLVTDAKNRIEKARKYAADLVKEARKAIYSLGLPIGGVAVQRLLKSTSSVPTSNAFIERLGPEFDLSRMLVVDFMHEFELGTWKSLFIHLIRILYAAAPGGKLVAVLDERFRHVPQFSQTIRRFVNNVSEMRKLAARDYEDLLQCSIPAFEGLLEEPHNKRLMKLLYRTAEWHGFAKLRMHTDSTLEHLEKLTKEFGLLMRQFRDLSCSQFQTMELPREATARARQRQRAQAKQLSNAQHELSTEASMRNDSSPTPTSNPTAPPSAPTSRKHKTLNLLTSKFHALGDYVRTIRLFGGTDSFSTQLGELAHRLVKRLYGRTNKRDATKQIGRRIRRLERAQLAAEQQLMKGQPQPHSVSTGASTEDVTEQNLDVRYQISNSRNDPIDIYSHVRAHRDDPAMKGFIPKLKDHILGRLMNREYEGDAYGEFTDEERNTVRIAGERIYRSKTLRINYTTYDVRRDGDTINPTSYPDIMVKSPETGPQAQPFWYARVIGIFHAMVSSSHQEVKNKSMQRMDFLWVRWFGVEPGRYRHGFQYAHLPKIGFVESSDDYAFTFLDPSEVIRGAHIIPAFSEGRTSALLPTTQSAARVLNPSEEDDWLNFYVNIFLDRDMLMRHFGSGVGHQDFARQSQIEPEITPVDVEEELIPSEMEDMDVDVNMEDYEEEDDDLDDEESSEPDSDDNSDNSDNSDNDGDDSDDNGYASF